MISRLTGGNRESGGAGLLPGVPVPRAGGRFSLPRVVAQALAYTGNPTAFPRLLTLSGEAFGVPGPCPLARETEHPSHERLLSGMAALGFRQARLLDSAGGLSGPEILAAVRAETGAGRPVVLHGWAPQPRGLSLIAGPGPGGLICGYSPSAAAGDPYLAAPPSGDFLLILGAPEGPAEDLFVLGCRAARRQWETERPGCADCYRAWQGLIAGGSATPELAAELGACLAALAVARGAAQEFLREATQGLAPAPAAWVRRAVNQYELLLERLEPLAERLAAPENQPPWSAEDQTEIAGALEAVAELDAEAVNCLRRAPEAEYGPG
jgi:hypothetical protein